MGDLFLVQQAVNLLGRVLDTPDSITAAPDHIGSLYKSVSGTCTRGICMCQTCACLAHRSARSRLDVPALCAT